MRLYEYLFSTPDPDDAEDGKNYLSNLNPQSLVVLTDCRVEPSLANAAVGHRCQFETPGLFLRG